eukprot:TRINITY_DN3024_c0_g1_i2.p1 TRINITY_DN3024_c0_g1~~TRINITY_DN3024_c0_g1_i2.p1  ORF type:complete len:490 (+),score=130.68 TRINITY_DN3024_c0_g1_i2:109-1578(+)
MHPIGVHRFYGFSPSIGVLRDPIDGATGNVLITNTGEFSSILRTIAEKRLKEPEKTLNIYVQENEPAVLARILLLLAVSLSPEIPVRQRVTEILEIYGNNFVTESTAEYVSRKSRELMDFICEERVDLIGGVADLKKLKYKEKDAMNELISAWSRKVDFNMDSLRDHRLRHHYADRYDFRSNLIDWDYQFDVRHSAGGIHSKQFATWRNTGVAFEFGDRSYTAPNRTMGSYAQGKSKSEGTSKLLRGFWGDIVASPYLALGLDAPEETGLLEIQNKKTGTEQWRHNAGEVATYNMLSLLYAIEHGKPYKMAIPHDIFSGLGEARDDAEATEESKIEEVDKDMDEEEALAQIEKKMRDIEVEEKNERTKCIKQGLEGVKIIPLLTPLASQRRLKGIMDVVLVGSGSVDMIGEPYFKNLLKDHATIITETVRHVPMKNKEARGIFRQKTIELATSNGFVPDSELQSGGVDCGGYMQEGEERYEHLFFRRGS